MPPRGPRTIEEQQKFVRNVKAQEEAKKTKPQEPPVFKSFSDNKIKETKPQKVPVFKSFSDNKVEETKPQKPSLLKSFFSSFSRTDPFVPAKDCVKP